MRTYRVFGWRVSIERERPVRERETVTVLEPFLVAERGQLRPTEPGERVTIESDLARSLIARGKAADTRGRFRR